MAVNERFLWGTGMLNLNPSDNILEIGCGAGLFAEQIANRLITGKIIAIDKSAPMIKMATKRNRNLIESGKATFSVADFGKTTFHQSQFDKIIAFNVNFFWKKPEKELELIRKYLKPEGHLYVFYQAPYGANEELKNSLINPLKANSFEIEDTVIQELNPVSALFIKAKPI